MKNSNVIYVDFVNRVRIEGPKAKLAKPKKAKKTKMTYNELHAINERIDEIDKALDLCVDGYDDDIRANLEIELEAIEQRLLNTKGA